jgi:hypothetical protein
VASEAVDGRAKVNIKLAYCPETDSLYIDKDQRQCFVPGIAAWPERAVKRVCALTDDNDLSAIATRCCAPAFAIARSSCRQTVQRTG